MQNSQEPRHRKLTLTDFNNTYFGMNRWYRSSTRCGCLMTDAVHKLVRAATDNPRRPLLGVEDDHETLYGKPVYVSPSLATIYSSIGLTGALIFGDLSAIVIRASRPSINRVTELSEADVTRGQALYIGRVRADGAVFDPSNSANPPLVLATIN